MHQLAADAGCSVVGSDVVRWETPAFYMIMSACGRTATAAAPGARRAARRVLMMRQSAGVPRLRLARRPAR